MFCFWNVLLRAPKCCSLIPSLLAAAVFCFYCVDRNREDALEFIEGLYKQLPYNEGIVLTPTIEVYLEYLSVVAQESKFVGDLTFFKEAHSCQKIQTSSTSTSKSSFTNTK